MRARFICVCFGVLMVHVQSWAHENALENEPSCDSTVVIAGIVTDEGGAGFHLPWWSIVAQMRENL